MSESDKYTVLTRCSNLLYEFTNMLFNRKIVTH